MTKIRKGLAVIVAIIVALTFTGCATVSRSDALEIEGSVLELTNGSWGTISTWGYVTESGNIIEMDNCGRPSIFDQRYCDSADGRYHFQWSTAKAGKIRRATLTIDGGAKRKLSCRVDADDTWSKLSVCVPQV